MHCKTSLGSSIVNNNFLSKLIKDKIIISVDPDLAIRHYLKKISKLEEVNEILAKAKIIIFFDDKRLYVALCTNGKWYLREYEFLPEAKEVFIYSKPRGGNILRLRKLLEVIE